MRSKTFLIVAIFFVIAIFWHFGFNQVMEADSFYYIRQASLLRQNGLLDTSFPWAYHSVIKENSSSLWYGFSVILLPFTYLGDIIGLKVAGAALTTAVMAAIFFIAKRHDFFSPWLWPLITFFSAPNVTAQLLMIRPQTISVALAPLLASFLVKGSPWPVAFLSFGIVWAHLNFAWLPIAIAGTVMGVRWILEKRIDWKKMAAVAVGILAGWLVRPNFFGAAKLFYVQVFQQIFEKQSGLPLLFGRENYPLSAQILFTNFLPLLIIFIVAIIFFVNKAKAFKNPEEKNLLWGTLILASIFFLLSIFVARRTYNFWSVFGIIFAGGVVTYLVRQKFSWLRRALAVLLVFLIIFSGWKTVNGFNAAGTSPERMRAAAAWLAENSNAGDIVFNLHWADFSELFFWNQKNYYVNGLDPIFLYSYNPSLYWKFHYLSIDQVTKKTCGAIECTRSMLEDTYEVLKRDFKAKYIVLSKDENPTVNFYLENDRNYEKKIQDKEVVVYLIK